MKDSFNFGNIYKLIYEGKNSKAKKKIEGIEKSRILIDDKLLTYLDLKCTYYISINCYEDGLRTANQLVDKAIQYENKMREIDGLLYKILNLIKLEKKSEVSSLIKIVEKNIKKVAKKDPSLIIARKARLLTSKGVIEYKSGNFVQSLDLHKKSLNLCLNVGNDYFTAITLLNVSEGFLSQGKMNKAMDYCLESIRISESANYLPVLALSLQNQGAIYKHKSELNQALKVYKRSLSLSQKLDNKYLIGSALYGIGDVYRSSGEIEDSFQTFQKCLKIFEELDNQRGISIVLSHLGIIYSDRGELDLSLEYHQKSLQIKKKSGNKLFVGTSLNNIAIVYSYKGELEVAREYFDNAYKLIRKVGNDIYTSLTLYYFIRFLIAYLPLPVLSNHLADLKEINDRQENKIINQAYSLAKALIYNRSDRLAKKGMAQQIFEQVIEGKMVYYDFTVDALLNMCGYLIYELEKTGKEVVLEEVKKLVDKLWEVAKSQHSYWLFSETYLLQSKIALLEFDIEKAQALLDKAYAIASEKGLKSLVKRIYKEKESFLK